MNNQGKSIAPRNLLHRMMGTSSSMGGQSSGQTSGPKYARVDKTRVTPGSQSFSKRRQIDRDRKIISKYGSSQLGGQYIRRFGAEISNGQHSRDKQVKNSRDTSASRLHRVETGQNQPSAGFREPPPRYNPYQ